MVVVIVDDEYDCCIFDLMCDVYCDFVCVV